jgi:hypothetical protein
MKKNVFKRFTDFLDRLEKEKIGYWLERSRDDAMMVIAVVPGEYWEVEFLEDGQVEVECYRSDGKIHDESILAEFLAKHSESPSENRAESHHDTLARN